MRKYMTLSGAALVVSMIMLGFTFGLGNSSSISTMGDHGEKQNQLVKRSVIRVHTDRGVIVLPGRADSWDSAERAEFVADSLADLQMVNNEVSIYSVSMN